jgi:peptidoglycan hydrolase-like protein with peptidoglycan-binding domain
MQTLHVGSSGPDVVTWQKIIGVDADGAFGPATEAATKAWQTSHGLDPDGIVGPMTWSKAGKSTSLYPTSGSMVSRARLVITSHEGRRAHVYLDQVGHPTVGIGFNLDRPDARNVIRSLGVDYDALVAGQVSLTDTQIDKLFDYTFREAYDAAQKLVPNFASLTSNARIVLVDMVFNMGAGGVAEFGSMLSALARGDYAGAVDGMRNSKWASEVPSRATYDMGLMVLPEIGIGIGAVLLLLGGGFALYEWLKS